MTQEQKEFLLTADFSVTEEPDEPHKHGYGRVSYRMNAADRSRMPAGGSEQMDELRDRLYALFIEKLGADYKRLELECDIKRNTFQKMVRRSSGKNIVYTPLAKFVVGAKIDVEEATRLFDMIDHHLSEKSRYDYILLCNLRNKGSVEEYNDDLVEFGYKSIYSALENKAPILEGDWES